MHRLLACCVLTLAFATAVSLQGCGQTGALYLPGEKPSVAVPAPEDEDEETSAQSGTGAT